MEKQQLDQNELYFHRNYGYDMYILIAINFSWAQTFTKYVLLCFHKCGNGIVLKTKR